MAHSPKPFFRESRGLWYVEIDKHQYKLGEHPVDLPPPKKGKQGWNPPEAIRAAFHRMMAHPPKLMPKRAKAEPVCEVPGDSVVAVVEKFLDWCKTHKAERTYDCYLERIQSFLHFSTPQYAVKDLTVEQLRPFHVDEWVYSHDTWSPGMRRGCMVAVQRAFNWAAKLGHIDRSPIAYLEKPPPGKRKEVITAEEFAAILAKVLNCEFKDLLLVAWEVGCRPQEIITVESRHVDVRNGRWMFEPEEAKGKKFHRIVYLSEKALEVTRRLLLRHPDGPIFRNTDGDPWTPYSVACAFRRVQSALGRERMRELGLKADEDEVRQLAASLPKEHVRKGKRRWKTECELRCEARKKLNLKIACQYGKKFCLYNFRHSWATRALQNGVDPVTVSVLMGHADVSMLARVYQHLSQNPEYLREAAKKARA